MGRLGTQGVRLVIESDTVIVPFFVGLRSFDGFPESKVRVGCCGHRYRTQNTKLPLIVTAGRATSSRSL